MAEVNENQNVSLSTQDTETKLQPWSPNLIAIITILFSMIPGGILHAFNYSRLGHPQRKKSALLSNVTMAVFLILVSIHTELPYIFFLVINLAYAGYFFKSQDSIFQDYIKKGGKKGSTIGPVVFSVLTTTLLLGLSLGYDHLKTGSSHKSVHGSRHR
jgi:uncharacterized membrane protein YfcA